MGKKKIQKFVRPVAGRFGKHFTVYVYTDPDATESMLLGPKHIVVIANRDLTMEEVDNRVNRFFYLDPKCMRCGLKYYDYFRVEMGPDGGIVRAVCGNCDPSAKFAVAYFEAIDPLIVPH